MSLRDDILAELERVPEYTKHENLWEVIVDRIMGMVDAAVVRGEIKGKDTLMMALEGWQGRRTINSTRLAYGIPQLPDGAKILYYEEPEEDTSE